ncbi:MAG: hypothetical protein V3U76_10965 [Granulosicoccus sp.]
MNNKLSTRGILGVHLALWWCVAGHFDPEFNRAEDKSCVSVSLVVRVTPV